jgi:mono/diheme cytochrome c family protein
MSRGPRLTLFASLILLPVFTVAFGLVAYSRHAVDRTAVTKDGDETPPDGPGLYAFHCAACHGINGDAQGPTSSALNPPARHFGMERFRLAGTSNGNPTDEDLLAVIRNGIPGTAMYGFPQLSEAEQLALVSEVRKRTASGLRRKLIKSYESEGGIDEAELGPLVHRLSQPGEPVAVPNPMPPSSAEAVARGRTLYIANCASCHGPDGRGDGPQVKDLKNENGHPTRPRDLTSGSYKGGGTPERLYVRLAVGLPGTPMPASATLKPHEICDLIHYVRSLATPAAATPQPR